MESVYMKMTVQVMGMIDDLSLCLEKLPVGEEFREWTGPSH